jgi:hypothetical protein
MVDTLGMIELNDVVTTPATVVSILDKPRVAKPYKRRFAIVFDLLSKVEDEVILLAGVNESNVTAARADMTRIFCKRLRCPIGCRGRSSGSIVRVAIEGVEYTTIKAISSKDRIHEQRNGQQTQEKTDESSHDDGCVMACQVTYDNNQSAK